MDPYREVDNVNALVKLDNATRMLAEVRTAKDAKKLMDLAAAAELYARKAKKGEEAEMHAYQIKIDAQTRLGEFLMEMPKAKPPSGKGQSRTDRRLHGETDGAHTFKENGISKTLAYRSQKLAKAKKTAPKLHAQVMDKKLSVAKLPEKLIQSEITDAQKEERANQATKKHTTRWLESVVVLFNSGVCPKKKAQEIDLKFGLYTDDPARKLTPDKLRSGAKWLTSVAAEWEKLL